MTIGYIEENHRGSLAILELYLVRPIRAMYKGWLFKSTQLRYKLDT